MSRDFRDDLKLAAYAVSLGFGLLGSPGQLSPAQFDDDGIPPPDSIQFVIGDVHVWNTARGWRVSRLVDGSYAKPSDSDFFDKLKHALDEGARNWRDR